MGIKTLVQAGTVVWLPDMPDMSPTQAALNLFGAELRARQS